MDPTVKRLESGQASQSCGVVTVPKTRKQNRNNRQQQKANKPNNKQKPPKAKKGIVKVPAQSKKGDDLCIAVERQYGVKH